MTRSRSGPASTLGRAPGRGRSRKRLPRRLLPEAPAGAVWPAASARRRAGRSPSTWRWPTQSFRPCLLPFKPSASETGACSGTPGSVAPASGPGAGFPSCCSSCEPLVARFSHRAVRRLWIRFQVYCKSMSERALHLPASTSATRRLSLSRDRRLSCEVALSRRAAGLARIPLFKAN